ncbi:MAG TPA: hypothetical protein VIM74_00600 [Casimicrobiaceae bacterium]
MNRGLNIVLLWAIAGSASAVTINAMIPPAANAPPPAPLSAASAKAMADDSSGLRKGTVEAVSVGAGTFQVYGQRLTFDARRVRVFGKDGKPSSIYALKSGAKIRFTLDAADALHRRVAVIYVD